MTPPPVILAVGLKAYLGARATVAWCERVASLTGGSSALAGTAPGVRVIVIPSMPMLPTAVAIFAGTPIEVGAQDVSVHGFGAHTGEVPGALLAELACTVVEVGHAERRAAGESGRTVATKAAAAWAAGLSPLVCVGEQRRGPADDAAVDAAVELEASIAYTPVRGEARQSLLVAYEPRWAIGADQPAPAPHVDVVCAALSRRVARLRPGHRHTVLYGGAAGPGTLLSLGPQVGGLFLGRRAHDPHLLTDLTLEAEYHHQVLLGGSDRA